MESRKRKNLKFKNVNPIAVLLQAIVYIVNFLNNFDLVLSTLLN
jgi:hypothetical protein